MNARRGETISALFPLVRSLARRVHRIIGIADLDDLVGDGSLGLIRAVDHFDPARGSSLETYAKRLIVGAMLNGLRRRDCVSERIRRSVRKAEIRRFALAQERMSLPTFAELERVDASLRRARTTAHQQAALSLDNPMPDGRDPLADTTLEPSRLAAQRAKRRAVQEAMALLPERQRRILALHYGDEEQSLHAIGSHMRISAQRVSQLHLLALARLRRALPNPP